jgi:hypothetical protein
MPTQLRLPPAGQLTVAGLTLFAVMIPIQIAGGYDNYPVIPPGLVISIAVLALVLLGRWWWTALVAVIWAAFLTVGALIAGTAGGNFAALDGSFEVITTVIQLLGLAMALAGGVPFALSRLRTRRVP